MLILVNFDWVCVKRKGLTLVPVERETVSVIRSRNRKHLTGFMETYGHMKVLVIGVCGIGKKPKHLFSFIPPMNLIFKLHFKDPKSAVATRKRLLINIWDCWIT